MAVHYRLSCALFNVVILLVSSSEVDRRLLLSDPTYLENKVNQLEATVQQLQNDVSTLKTSLGQEQAKVALLSAGKLWKSTVVYISDHK